MRLSPLAFFCLLPALGWAQETPASVIDYRDGTGGHAGVILDARAEAACREGSLPGARCLPATALIGPHGRLANLSGLLWLLGSVGLTGDEHVLVVGGPGAEKEQLAGILYLAGQRRISVLRQALDALEGAERRPGIPRGRTREAVYTAAMRDDRVVLRDELRRLVASGEGPPLMDGREESEYWGARVRGARGGHLPGAQLLPLRGLAGEAEALERHPFDPANPWVVYGHDTPEGLVYLSRLLALGVEPRLYLEGWTGWASDGSLPVDSLTFRDAPVAGRPPAGERADWRGGLLPACLLGAALLAVAGYGLGRRAAG